MTEIKLPYFCCACEYEPENFDPENGDFDCPKCGCEIIVNESKVIQTITALRARIEELTIPADIRETLIDALNMRLAREYFDQELPEEVAEHSLIHRTIDWLTAYKEAHDNE